VANTQIGDLSVAHLARLRRLKLLNVANTHLTRSGIDQVRRALPLTRIVTIMPQAGGKQMDVQKKESVSQGSLEAKP
jgi:hypothetical protein